MGNFPSPYIILFTTCKLEDAIFAWSILSWITYKNSSFDHIDSDLQVWFKLLHDYWCKRCFFNFSSYSFASLLFFPNLNIKSLKDSHVIHFAKVGPLFHTLGCKHNKTTHTQFLGALLKSSGLANHNDVAKLDWFITKNILRIIFYKFSKNYFDPIDGVVYYFLQEYVIFFINMSFSNSHKAS